MVGGDVAAILNYKVHDKSIYNLKDIEAVSQPHSLPSFFSFFPFL